MALGARDAAVVVIPLLSALEGLGVVALAVALVRRAAPADPLRIALAGLLLLYLPAHLHMSAMVNEGMLLALLTSLAVYGLAVRDAAARPAIRSPTPPAVGLASGLALLTKLSGVLAILTGVATHAIDGWRERRARAPPPAAPCSCSSRSPSAAGSTSACSSRPARSSRSPWGPTPACSSCRPASARWPISCACRSRPSAIRSSSNPDLLHSVWGSTYVTVWFDGHRFFLPRESAAVQPAGHADARARAAADGGVRAGARARRPASGCAARARVDLPLLLLTAATLASYAWFTWRNPFFSVVKGTSLLGLSPALLVLRERDARGLAARALRALDRRRAVRARGLRRALLYLRPRVHEDRGVGPAVAAGGGRMSRRRGPARSACARGSSAGCPRS